MTNIQVFQNPEFGAVRAIEEGGEIWFDAFDMLKVLGWDSRFSGVLEYVDDDDKDVIEVPGEEEDCPEHVTCINKCGLYAIFLTMDFPQDRRAREIKKWVADEIIPAMVGVSSQ